MINIKNSNTKKRDTELNYNISRVPLEKIKIKQNSESKYKQSGNSILNFTPNFEYSPNISENKYKKREDNSSSDVIIRNIFNKEDHLLIKSEIKKPNINILKNHMRNKTLEEKKVNKLINSFSNKKIIEKKKKPLIICGINIRSFFTNKCK